MMTPERFVHYRVGVDCIDQDHFFMLKEMDTVISLTKSGEIKKAKEKFVKTLEFIKEHFTKEENFLESINYRYLESHKQDHKRILSVVSNIAENMETHSRLLDRYVSTFEDIFIAHIDRQDMQYSQYISENHLAPESIHY